jgi:hypothetical protein
VLHSEDKHELKRRAKKTNYGQSLGLGWVRVRVRVRARARVRITARIRVRVRVRAFFFFFSCLAVYRALDRWILLFKSPIKTENRLVRFVSLFFCCLPQTKEPDAVAKCEGDEPPPIRSAHHFYRVG